MTPAVFQGGPRYLLGRGGGSVTVNPDGSMTLAPASGKTINLSGFTAGSILFAGTAGAISQDNAGLSYFPPIGTLQLAGGASSGATPAANGIVCVANGMDATEAATQLYGQVFVYRAFTSPPATTQAYLNSGFCAYLSTYQNGTPSLRGRTGFYSRVQDHPNAVNRTVSGAANNGSGLVRVTTSTAHTFATNDQIAVYDVLGTTEANGAWVVTVIDSTHFDLQGSTFTNAYVSGGTVTNRGLFYGYLVAVVPSLDRIALAAGGGTAQNTDDIGGYCVINEGTGRATDAFYAGHNEANFSGVSEWGTGVTIDANCEKGFSLGGRIGIAGLDFTNATFATAGTEIKFDNGLFLGVNAAGGVTLTGNAVATRLVLGGATALLGTTILELQSAGNADPAILLHSSSGTASLTARISNGVGVCRWFVVGTAGAFLTGSVVGDTGFVCDTAAKQFHIGGTTKVITVTQDNKLGFFAATPVVQPTGTTDLRTALINLGLYATGGATPLNLNGGLMTAGRYNGGLANGRVTANVTINSTTMANLTGLSFAIGASEVWAGDVFLQITGNTNGLKFDATGPASPTDLLLHFFGNTSGITAFSTDSVTAFSTATTTVFVSTTAAKQFVHIRFSINNGANAGTVQFRAGTLSGTNSSTVTLNSFLRCRRVA